jgi:two-component system sensor histidine kinase BaeS
MRLTIFHKLFISLLLTSMIMMLGMALLINNSFQSGLQTYLNQREVKQLEFIASQIGEYYSSTNGWSLIKKDPAIWENLLKQIGERPEVSDEPTDTHPPERRLNRQDLKQLYKRIHLLDDKGNMVFDKLDIPDNKKSDPLFIQVPVRSDGQVVGKITMIQRRAITGELAEGFYKQQLNNFYLIAIWVALFSFIVAGFLVRHLLQPLKNLHSGAIALQRGDFKTKIPVKGNDELAELSATFNSLTATLKQQKITREQWLADISHELRTPIGVLISEIEAIEDGIRQPEPKYIHSLHSQVMNLKQLVEDLYQLSLSDSGVNIDKSQWVDLTKLLDMAAEQNEVRLANKHITLERHYNRAESVLIKADSTAITQLITNILENSYRYTDPEGVIEVSILQSKKNIELVIADSEPSVPEESLSKLFERLYRVDKSRSRANGGSGLGLSICKNIVAAHDGKITAEQSLLGGLQIKILLPIEGS